MDAIPEKQKAKEKKGTDKAAKGEFQSFQLQQIYLHSSFPNQTNIN